jgi:hypothetical protein
MDDVLSSLLGTSDSGVLGTLGALNGSSAPNSSPTGLSTPVNTSGGNTNTSGSLISFLSGLAGIGSTAAQAYATATGRPVPATTTAKPVTAVATGLAAYLPWILTGGGLLLLILLLTRAARR